MHGEREEEQRRENSLGIYTGRRAQLSFAIITKSVNMYERSSTDPSIAIAQHRCYGADDRGAERPYMS